MEIPTVLPYLDYWHSFPTDGKIPELTDGYLLNSPVRSQRLPCRWFDGRKRTLCRLKTEPSDRGETCRSLFFFISASVSRNRCPGQGRDASRLEFMSFKCMRGKGKVDGGGQDRGRGSTERWVNRFVLKRKNRKGGYYSRLRSTR